MKRFFKLSAKITNIIIVIVFTAAGIVPKAEVQEAFASQTQTTKEFINVTASVDNELPLQNTIINITVTGPAEATVNLICHYKLGDISYSGLIGNDGKAIIPIMIDAASPGYAVFVDVHVISDKTYTTETMFIPQ